MCTQSARRNIHLLFLQKLENKSHKWKSQLQFINYTVTPKWNLIANKIINIFIPFLHHTAWLCRNYTCQRVENLYLSNWSSKNLHFASLDISLLKKFLSPRMTQTDKARKICVLFVIMQECNANEQRGNLQFLHLLP